MANGTATKTKNLAAQVEHLREEVVRLRSLAIGMIAEDKEGSYNPAFVRRVLEAAKEQPRYAFRGKKSFLSQLTDA